MSQQYKGKPWSYGIIIAILVFMIGTLTMVYILVSQKVEILYPDYYQRTTNYDQVQKELSFGLEPRFRVQQTFNATRDSLILRMPEVSSAIGTVSFIKPDDSALDTSFKFSIEDSSAIAIPINQLKKGAWQIEIAWQVDSTKILSRLKISI
jgi:hypothetical protein